jgi:hypothetical protein
MILTVELFVFATELGLQKMLLQTRYVLLGLCYVLQYSITVVRVQRFTFHVADIDLWINKMSLAERSWEWYW